MSNPPARPNPGYPWPCPHLALLLCSSLVLTGCFSYRAIEPGVIRPNEQIRVIVTDDAALRVSAQFGVPAPLEGEFAALGRDSIGVNVWIGRSYSGSEFATARQTIPLIRTDILEVQQRRLSVKRTILAGVGALAITAILVNRLGLVELPWLDSTEPPTPPNPEEPDPFRSFRQVNRRF